MANNNEKINWEELREARSSDLESGLELDYFSPELEKTISNLLKEVELDTDVNLLEEVAYDVYLGTEGQIDFNAMVEPRELTELYENVESEAYSHIGAGDVFNYFTGSSDAAKENVVNKLIEKDFQPVINYFYNVHNAISTKLAHIKKIDPDNYSAKLFNMTKGIAQTFFDKFTEGGKKDSPAGDDIILNNFFNKYGSLILDKEELQKVLMYGMPYVYSDEGKKNILGLVDTYKKDIGVKGGFYESQSDENNMFKTLRNGG